MYRLKEVTPPVGGPPRISLGSNEKPAPPTDDGGDETATHGETLRLPPAFHFFPVFACCAVGTTKENKHEWHPAYHINVRWIVFVETSPVACRALNTE